MIPQLPLERSHPLATAPVLRALQTQGPIHRVRTQAGDPAWLVTGYQEVRDLLGDDRVGRAHPEPDKAARANKGSLFGGKPAENYATEDADHAWMRGAMQPHFAPGRMRKIRPRIEELADRLFDDLAGRTPPVDLHEALAAPLPILVICELLGVPYEDRDRFRDWSEAMIDIQDTERSEAGMAELMNYCKGLAQHKRKDPGDDVISRMCEEHDDDIAAGFAWALLFAGHETTVIQMDYGAALLLSNTDQWHALRNDPSLLTTAVEECLRTGAGNGGGSGIPRYTRTEIEVGRQTIPAGDLLLLDTGAANHDAVIYPDPDRFDVTRKDAPNVTFGYGSRYCIGAPLARIELEVAFSRLIDRFPTMRLAVPIEGLPERKDVLTGGFAALPVTW